MGSAFRGTFDEAVPTRYNEYETKIHTIDTQTVTKSTHWVTLYSAETKVYDFSLRLK